MTTVKHPVQPKSKSLVRREPAVTVGVITAIVAAAFGVATAFGLHLSDDQVKALVVFVGAVAVTCGVETLVTFGLPSLPHAARESTIIAAIAAFFILPAPDL
jgi:predicted outer membrane lipoprotein